MAWVVQKSSLKDIDDLGIQADEKSVPHNSLDLANNRDHPDPLVVREPQKSECCKSSFLHEA